MIEKMSVKECFRASKKNIASCEYNIFIPLCLGNKYFSSDGELSDNVPKYLDWALGHTKDKVSFLVVDKIQDTNYIVRGGASEKRALSRVLGDGKKITRNLNSLLDSNYSDKRDVVDVIRWQECVGENPWYNDASIILYKEFKNNVFFRKTVLNAVRSSVRDRPFNEEDYLRLSDYFLDEFALCYSGFDFAGENYNLFVYPNTDSALYLIEGIKAGELFPKLKEKLPQRKSAVAILNENVGE